MKSLAFIHSRNHHNYLVLIKPFRSSSHLDYSLNVTVPFREVFRPEFRGSFTVLGVSFENSTGTFTLGADNSSHAVLLGFTRLLLYKQR